MKVGFVEKGGGGKTTLASLFARYFAEQGADVLAIDVDISQHLGVALEFSASKAAALPAMGLEIDRIKAYVHGSNLRICSNAVMVKTTPQGHGSCLLRVGENNPIYEYFARKVNGVRLMATGPFNQDDLGHKCYHSKIGAIGLIQTMNSHPKYNNLCKYAHYSSQRSVIVHCFLYYMKHNIYDRYHFE